jgi:hypothetical protein
MEAKKFEQQFEDGDDLTASLDLSKAKRVQQEQQQVNTDSERLEAGASKISPQRTRATAAHR